MFQTQIIAAGSHFPERTMTNQEFESIVETSDEWIRTRTGIQQRKIIDRNKNETTTTLAIEAAKKALAKSQMSPDEIGLVLVSTVTADTPMPTTGNCVQKALNCKNAFSFDLQAACAGWVYGISIADQYIRTGAVKSAIVIGAESLSTITNWKDRSTCVLFGDGAGATVLTRSNHPKHQILGTRLYADPWKSDILKIPPWYSEEAEGRGKIFMAGSEVFKVAVRNMIECSEALLAENNMKPNEVDFFIFHQANIRIIEMAIKHFGIPAKKTWINVEKYGNTSAATLPVALDEAMAAGAVKPGQTVLVSTFGGGLVWGGALFRL